jgi:hypothetical protein
MRKLFGGLAILCVVAVAAPARGQDVPNINKRDNEKAMVKQTAEAIVKTARKAKDITVQDFKFKDAGAGKKELHISAGYKGIVLKTKYTADIVVEFNTANKDKWTVTNIKYTDNNKNKLTLSPQKIEALVAKFNKASE